ncbi:TIGR04104 family putative zinc finger protein [Evansella clarkii]|uniref:TIGR04104 family putative zinc finger protein n=1 Tax=Evansella clarkii TaxID=79879 RepID=UPI00099857AE|nr:TIGR04104 family putative zinc finger protein [Evansella clarkii]
MKLPECRVCAHQFRWEKVLVSCWFGRGIECQVCGTNHKKNKQEQFLDDNYPLITYQLFFYNFIESRLSYPDSDLNTIIYLSTGMAYYSIISFMFPYFTEYKAIETDN